MNRSDLEKWFKITHSNDPQGVCEHTWCVQSEPGQWKPHLPALISYLENAHADARNCFLISLGLNLDPLGGESLVYPCDLPHDTKRGYFGEALCGIIASEMEIIGGDRWIVPAFLFRFHEEARLYLTRLVIGEGVGKSIAGRTGSDFIALCLDDNGWISKYLVGEAKCHKLLNMTKCGKALNKLGKEASTPVSLLQLRDIVNDIDPDANASLIDSIDDIFMNQKFSLIPRVDLFLYAFDDSGVKQYNSVRITEELRRSNYQSDRKLHVFEIHIPDGAELVTVAYNGMYREVDRAAG